LLNSKSSNSGSPSYKKDNGGKYSMRDHLLNILDADGNPVRHGNVIDTQINPSPPREMKPKPKYMASISKETKKEFSLKETDLPLYMRDDCDVVDHLDTNIRLSEKFNEV